MANKKYLVLENGTVFEGLAFGAETSATGEIVFTTSMVGYLETLTDPNYFGQMVVQTFPLIGNYGVIPSDFESKSIHLSAYIVRQWCQEPSNFRSEGDLDTFLKQQGVPGIYDIDTRKLTRIIRDNNVMNAALVDDITRLDEIVSGLQGKKMQQAVASVSAASSSIQQAENAWGKVVLWDFGTKNSTREELLKRGCTVVTMPYNASAADIAKHQPDGVVLSDGPGDPADNPFIVTELKALCSKNIPLFGIGLGHQMLALSQGANTEQMPLGHRGSSQPVRDTATKQVHITQQNHGYVVVSNTLPADATVRWENVNDGTCEGIDYSAIPAFSVQFAPEGQSGALADLLFDRFVRLMKEGA